MVRAGRVQNGEVHVLTVRLQCPRQLVCGHCAADASRAILCADAQHAAHKTALDHRCAVHAVPGD